MSQTLRLAVSQSHTLSTTSATLSALKSITHRAKSQSVDLLLFPEAYLGGYPRTATFGAAVGARKDEGREQFLRYFKDAVDLGDTPEGAGKAWIERKLDVDAVGKRGDGSREELERIAKDSGVFLVVGLVERCGGTLYCGVLYVCPELGVIGKRRKVMPTGSERLIWGQGQPSSLRAVTTTIKGVKLTLAAAICWENYMPLLRQSLYSQNVNLYLAPTADQRDTWLPLLQTIACEGRCVVLSANQCIRESDLPSWITGKRAEGAEGADGRSDSNGTNGASPLARLRRKSAITGDGFEIALPEEQRKIVQPPPTKLRRQSTITEDGHEIVLPGIKGSTTAIDEEPSGNGTPKPTKLRRNSTVTEDGHEIALPESKRSLLSVAQHESPVKSGLQAFASRGGSCIISPTGQVLAGPLWDDDDGLIVQDVDFDDCVRGRLDLDVGGSYSRNDSFKLTVAGLDLSPPP